MASSFISQEVDKRTFASRRITSGRCKSKDRIEEPLASIAVDPSDVRIAHWIDVNEAGSMRHLTLRLVNVSQIRHVLS